MPARPILAATNVTITVVGGTDENREHPAFEAQFIFGPGMTLDSNQPLGTKMNAGRMLTSGPLPPTHQAKLLCADHAS